MANLILATIEELIIPISIIMVLVVAMFCKGF